MLISVIIPVYNERSTVEEVIERVRQVDLPKEIIVVDDGCTDGSTEIIQASARYPEVKVIRQERNRGKGWAIRQGLKAVTGDLVIIQDADLELDPEDFHALIAPLIQEGADVVYGSRFLRRLPHIPWKTRLVNQALAAFTNLLFGSRLTDEATAYKVFRAEVILSLPLECERFEFCPEVTAKLLRRGYFIREVPIGYHPRSKAEGKKVTWRDGVQAVKTLWRYRFGDVTVGEAARSPAASGSDQPQPDGRCADVK
jgi:glycosyltransferase involved in cell wall biosynthesis